jgi:hypothetical protein
VQQEAGALDIHRAYWATGWGTGSKTELPQHGGGSGSGSGAMKCPKCQAPLEPVPMDTSSLLSTSVVGNAHGIIAEWTYLCTLSVHPFQVAFRNTNTLFVSRRLPLERSLLQCSVRLARWGRMCIIASTGYLACPGHVFATFNKHHKVAI